MVDNLYTFDEIRAALPDNVSNLISPNNVRSASLSLATDAGEVGDGSSWVLALAPGVPSNLNAASPAAAGEILRGWAIDGNGALISDLAAEFTIAPGHLRGVNMIAIVVCQNAGIPDDVFTFDLLRGAIVVGTVTLTLEGGANAEDQALGIAAMESYEPALAEPWSVQVSSVGGEDLAITDWDLRATGIVT